MYMLICNARASLNHSSASNNLLSFFLKLSFHLMLLVILFLIVFKLSLQCLIYFEHTILSTSQRYIPYYFFYALQNK